MKIIIANATHAEYAELICNTIEESAKVRGTGIARRTPEYILTKMTNGNAIIAQEILSVKLTEKELRQVAEVMDTNGGHQVELCALEKLTERLQEEIFTKQLPEILPEDTEWENIYVELQEDMPQELVEAADQYVRMKSVTFVYFIQKDGTELKREGEFGISPKAFAAMRKTALSEEARESDYELMQRLFPKEYEEVTELVKEYAFKECVRDFGQGFPAVLKEFPYQVYTNL